MKKYDVYYGAYNPNRKDYINSILDEQQDIMIGVEESANKDNLRKRGLILGVGVMIILSVLVIYKYK